MCGIVGYIGKKNALPIIIEGLKQLEYRGYDSAGVALVSEGDVKIAKRSGKIKDLVSFIKDKQDLDGSIVGIGHSRWATHGAPTNTNAHPHTDCSGEFAIVHNGIIENFREIREHLIKEGHEFKSETDTETIAHLIEKYYRGDIEKAVLKAVRKLRGSFALGVISKNEPHKLIGVRNQSPLIVGIGKEENFIASDIPAVLKHTKKVLYLDDKEIVVLTKDKVRVMDLKGKERKKKPDIIKWTVSSAQKSGYPHFMLKEIHEQPKVLRQIISSRVKSGANISLDGIDLSRNDIKNISNIIILACGTAYHAGVVGQYLLERFSRIPVTVYLSSEFRYRNPIINNKALVIAISQSGETADTLAAVKLAKTKGVKILSICNVVGSSLVRISDGVLYTYAGPEIGVASTKAYTAQLAILYLLTFYLAEIKGELKKEKKRYLLRELKGVPEKLQRLLDEKKIIQRFAAKHLHHGSFLYLGRNLNYPTALEGALKLKEISYIPAEGYAAGEMKHGPIALIDEYRAVVCVSPFSTIYEKMVSNIQEICARKGKVIIVATEGDEEAKNFTKEVIYIPKTDEFFSPIITVLPLQLLAYYIAVKRKCDVDQPRNLAKSVTVE
ncbi:MAG: glutamine--fructose-6-phosphate transaminase (isomerizing) [Candidatus Omnitrophota bacterium]|nr:glutamine--fructose-6-phosphate transaminase (isomerizing) [Candidatus Omnitrophota bacterium]